MNEIVSKFLLETDKFVPEMCKDILDLHRVLVDHLQKKKKKKKECKNLKKQEIHDIFIKTN